jgi:hypothetical protein
VNPSIVILPAGAADRWVYRTDLDGTIVISLESAGMRVETARGQGAYSPAFHPEICSLVSGAGRSQVLFSVTMLEVSLETCTASRTSSV